MVKLLSKTASWFIYIVTDKRAFTILVAAATFWLGYLNAPPRVPLPDPAPLFLTLSTPDPRTEVLSDMDWVVPLPAGIHDCSCASDRDAYGYHEFVICTVRENTLRVTAPRPERVRAVCYRKAP